VIVDGIPNVSSVEELQIRWSPSRRMWYSSDEQFSYNKTKLLKSLAKNMSVTIMKLHNYISDSIIWTEQEQETLRSLQNATPIVPKYWHHPT
jgi:hypothetical protein